MDSGDLSDARNTLKDTLDGLITEQGMIAKLPIWPWRVETISSVGAAVLAPIIIWILQRLLERLGI